MIASVASMAYLLARDDAPQSSRASCQEPFLVDQRAWDTPAFAPDVKPPTPRQKEAQRIVKCAGLLDLTRKQVREVLGPPEQLGADDGSGGRSWLYWTGPREFIPIDSDFLAVRFRAGKVGQVDAGRG